MYDVVVVGSGNAGISAALAARDAGVSVCVVEKAPRAWAGGNSYFTAGAFRLGFESLDDLRSLVPLSDEEAEAIELAPYGPEALLADIERVTGGRTDPGLARILAHESRDAADWLRRHGVAWRLMYDRQSFRVEDRVRFWGNLVVGSVDGGRGLIEAELEAARRAGIELRFETPVVDLRQSGGRVTGVVFGDPGTRGHRGVIEAGAVILASGGFEADAERRAAALGPAWRHARVRGTPYNTGEMLFAALAAGATPAGDWSGAHAIAWDAAAPDHGDRAVTNRYSRQGYPFGLVVNAEGRRFLDEGADFRNYTYAKYGAEILHQPGSIAYQLFDQQSLPYVSAIDYDTAVGSRFEADSVAELERLIGTPAESLVRTIDDYNAGVRDAPFDPTRKDGRRTEGVEPPKSNWALRFDHPPFVAFAVRCGITFTFGGLRIDAGARVVDVDGAPIPGLFAAGELVGGLFYGNYPGGSGLAAGTVFGRRAGESATGSSAGILHGARAVRAGATTTSVPPSSDGDTQGKVHGGEVEVA
jgi:tricarballylate dehydrogenase